MCKHNFYALSEHNFFTIRFYVFPFAPENVEMLQFGHMLIDKKFNGSFSLANFKHTLEI